MSDGDATEFDAAQQAEALALIESAGVPWGSIEQSIIDFESALLIALDMTSDDFRRWEDEVKPALQDEGSFDDDLFVVESGVELSDEDERAYLAGLIKEMALGNRR